MSYSIKGRISDKDRNPIGGLTVNAYDDDLFFDDFLGSTKTGNDGSFEIRYSKGNFRSLFDRESAPDIYLILKTQDGRVIHRTDVIRGVGRIERFYIQLREELAKMKAPTVAGRLRTCSELQPMYCTADKLGKMFEVESFPVESLVNTGIRSIDVNEETVYDDTHWRGFYPTDTLLPPWIFQNGFYKEFSLEGSKVKGVTRAFDETVQALNEANQIDPHDPSKGIILQYTEPQFSMFYDLLKMINDDVVIGKAYIGRYPNGLPFLNFAMARRYSFDFLTATDHKELFEKHGYVPEPVAIVGEWEGRMISNASPTPPLFRFRYELDPEGKITCRYIFMHLIRGDSRVELTESQMEMFDFTNLHDEIRMVKDDLMVGKYCPEGQEILNIIGDRSLGLLHFEETSEGTRSCVYYAIRKVSN